MVINTSNFELFELADRTSINIFPDSNGWTVLKNIDLSLEEYYGVTELYFLIFVEIYDLQGNLIINYPVETSGEQEVEERMKKQISFYSLHFENKIVSAAALKFSLVTPEEFTAFESLTSPEEFLCKIKLCTK